MFIVPVPVFSIVCYLLDRDAPAKLLLSYVARDAWALVLLMVIAVWKLRWLFQKGEKEALTAKLREIEVGLVEGTTPDGERRENSETAGVGPQITNVA
jgi:tellurite resistance protein TehA-like permease